MLEVMKIKKQFLIAVITVFFISCTGFFDLREDVKIVDKSVVGDDGQVISSTHIYFDNTRNIFPVDIFSDHTRTFKVNKDRVQPNHITGNISWLPTTTNEEFIFYLTFYLPIAYDIQIPFIPQKWGAALTRITIPFQSTKRVQIHDLTSIIPSNDFLIDDVCIIIENNFTSAIQLNHSSLVLQPENNNNGIITINPGSKGFYKVKPASTTAGYSVLSNNIHNLPAAMTSLVSGYVYIIEITGSGLPVLEDQFPLTMRKFM